jgi:hypothetical protein
MAMAMGKAVNHCSDELLAQPAIHGYCLRRVRASREVPPQREEWTCPSVPGAGMGARLAEPDTSELDRPERRTPPTGVVETSVRSSGAEGLWAQTITASSGLGAEKGSAAPRPKRMTMSGRRPGIPTRLARSARSPGGRGNLPGISLRLGLDGEDRIEQPGTQPLRQGRIAAGSAEQPVARAQGGVRAEAAPVLELSHGGRVAGLGVLKRRPST